MRKLNAIISLTMSAVMITAPINSVVCSGATSSEPNIQISTNVAKPVKVVVKKSYTASTNSLKFSWNKVSSVSGYKIYQYKDKVWKNIAVIKDPNTTSYMLSGLSSGTEYKVRVCAYKNVNGNNILLGAKSDVKYLSTKPKTVGKIKTSSSVNSIKLSWGKTKCTGYQIFKVNGKTTKKIATVKSSSKTSYTVGSLEDGKNYTFKVRAYSTDTNGQINYGSSVSVKAKTEAKSQAQKVIEIVNKERSKQGLKSLKYDSKLTNVANIRVKEIATKFSHERPNGTYFYDIMNSKNIPYYHSGENIASGFQNAQSVMTAWMNSTGHRKNILTENYTKIGVGYDSKTKCWVQIFSD